MATLTNQTVASTYPLLLKMQTSSLHATDLGIVEDGDGSPAGSALRISGAAVNSSGTLTSTGDFDVNTDKFTVAAATGNSIIAGTLGVTGVITATGGVTGDVTGDITGAVTATSGSLATSVTAVTQTASDNSTKVATTAYVDALTTIPAGCITQYGGSAAPSGWLLCGGAAVSRTTYSDLFDAIATLYGVGDDSTTFNLPDLQGKVPVGKAASGTFNTLNNSGGTETHPLTESEMPAHDHALTLPIVLDYATTEQVAWYKSEYVHDYYGNPSNLAMGTSDAGEGDPHTNLQPYLVVNYIIKT